MKTCIREGGEQRLFSTEEYINFQCRTSGVFECDNNDNLAKSLKEEGVLGNRHNVACFTNIIIGIN